jgi:hypothetical protein
MAGSETKRVPMETKEGDKVRCVLDDENYIVTRIVNRLVVLKSTDGEKRILTGKDSLKIFYKKMEEVSL